MESVEHQEKMVGSETRRDVSERQEGVGKKCTLVDEGQKVAGIKPPKWHQPTY